MIDRTSAPEDPARVDEFTENAPDPAPVGVLVNGEQAPGGVPVLPRIPQFARWPYFAKDEVDAAAAVLVSGKVNYWTGFEGRTFETEFAERIGCRHGIALANGTLALELALYALGIGPGDEVITTSRTFIASASAAVMRGAVPVIADVDRDSGNITADTIRAVITPRTRAIIPVHLAGWPCDMDAIMELAQEHDLFVIEDCAQALGATVRGRQVGTFGDAAAFSFCQDKIITTGGEGGMLTTNSDELWERAWSYKDHGKSLEALEPPPGGAGFRWLHDSFGTNWRLSEMQAAVGRAQMRKLPAWLEQRRANAAVLMEGLAETPGLRVPAPAAHIGHAYYKFYTYLIPERLRWGWDRAAIAEAISDRGVPCLSGSCSEIYREKAFVDAGLGPEQPLPVASELGETSLMFLVHPTLGEEHMEYAAQVINEVMSEAAV